ncbi:GtrA family protein [Brooklawnia sp.]|uniref:GtrA family protein n=1 Tax=Brooklawnia sp. TaxID=2699740 RepID=UPI00311FCC05
MSEEPRPARGRLLAVLVQFIKFGLVGGSGVLVNLIVTYIMTQVNGGVGNDNNIIFQLPGRFAFRFTILVWIVAFLIANFWNFQLNRSWTFKRAKTRGWWAEFWPFFFVGAIAALIGALIKVALTNPTSPVYLPSPMFNDHEGLRARAYWAQLITIVLTMPVNYLVNKVWTFRAVKDTRTKSGVQVAPSAPVEPSGSEVV